MSGAVPPGDQARVAVRVGVEPAAAFRVFTEEIDRWWRRGPAFRTSGNERGVLRIEPRVGGRLFETIAGAAGTRVVATGEVLVWEPPTRLVLRWRGVNFAPHEHTEVEVAFAAAGSGTLVTVTHRGWSAIRPDHPARHGEDVPAFVRMLGLWWGDLLTALREHAAP
ncbi:MAG: SRPBCC domain-containing protein [Planctomycetota bacterium]